MTGKQFWAKAQNYWDTAPDWLQWAVELIILIGILKLLATLETL